MLISQIETIYCNILSEEYVAALDPNIVDHIRVVLKREVYVTDLLVRIIPPCVSPQCFDNVTNFLLLIYSRIRGKDFVIKLLKIV